MFDAIKRQLNEIQTTFLQRLANLFTYEQDTEPDLTIRQELKEAHGKILQNGPHPLLLDDLVVLINRFEQTESMRKKRRNKTNISTISQEKISKSHTLTEQLTVKLNLMILEARACIEPLDPWNHDKSIANI